MRAPERISSCGLARRFFERSGSVRPIAGWGLLVLLGVGLRAKMGLGLVSNGDHHPGEGMMVRPVDVCRNALRIAIVTLVATPLRVVPDPLTALGRKA